MVRYLSKQAKVQMQKDFANANRCFDENLHPDYVQVNCPSHLVDSVEYRYGKNAGYVLSDGDYFDPKTCKFYRLVTLD